MQPYDANHEPRLDKDAIRLCSFIPHFQMQLLAERGCLPTAATRQDGYGVLLFIDISGFTAMTEHFGRKGPRGAEQMSSLLNEHYGALVDLISLYGGDVVAFAGDAVLALWKTTPKETLPELAHAAGKCGLEVQRAVLSRNAAANKATIEVKVSVGAGSISCYEIGGINDRWHWLVTGEPLDQVAELDGLVQPGQVLGSSRVAGLLEDFVMEPLPKGGVAILNTPDTLTTPTNNSAQRLPPRVSDQLIEPFVLDVVKDRLRAHQAAFLAEFRHVSIGFMQIQTPNSSEEIQDIIQQTQTVLDQFGGVLYQCLCDDKGFVVIMAFGMPPFAHENDAERILLAAMSLLEAMPNSISIGICTGRLFCGAYGGSTRQQYSLVGPTMNLAARLMQAANRSVVCDETTAHAAQAQVELRPLDSLLVKGREESVVVYEPVKRQMRDVKVTSRIFGRDQVLSELTRHVCGKHTGKSGSSPAVLIEAEAGMGKSTLVAAIVKAAEDAEIRTIIGHADAIETHTPYFPFRKMLKQCLLDDQDPMKTLRDMFDGAGLLEFVPLINTFWPEISEEEENPVTIGLSAAARAERTNQLLLRVFSVLSNSAPMLLVLEDGHWLDSTSWVLLKQISSRIPRCTVLLTTRPLGSEKPEFDAMVDEPGAFYVSLDTLDGNALEAIVAHVLGVESLPTAFSALILERAEGNPFFAQELAYALRDAGTIKIENGRLRVVSSVAFDASGIPDRVQDVIASRVDSLPPQAQLTIKVASIIGRVFEIDDLLEVHPQSLTTRELQSNLEILENAKLISAEPGAQLSSAYRFHHAVIQDSVYELLTYDQRRTLHKASALHLTRSHEHDLEGILPRLAHHYSEAEMPTEAMTTSRDAGLKAVATFANREALRFLHDALEFEASSSTRFTRLERTIIHVELANTYYGLTNYEMTIEQAKTAVREAGFKPPLGGWGIPLEFARMAVHSAREHLHGRREPELEGTLHEERLESLKAIAAAMPSLMFLARNAEYLESALKLHNLAAGLEPSAESSTCRAAMGLCFAMLGWVNRAERELRRALSEVLEVEQRESQATIYSLLGMFLHMQGKLEESTDCGKRACDILDVSNVVDMWHHRAKMGYSTVLSARGFYDQAAESYAETAVLTWEAEPQVFGLIVALQGQTLLRAGRSEEAAPLLEEGVRRSRDHDSVLPLFASLGAIAELKLREGNIDDAIAAAFEAEGVAENSGEVNSYLQAFCGHTGILMVYCELLAHPDEHGHGSTLSRRRVKRHALRASKKLRRFSNKFVCMQPHYLALEGLRQYHLGKNRKAEAHWINARNQATDIGLPYEIALASYFLECHGEGKVAHAWGGVELLKRT